MKKLALILCVLFIPSISSAGPSIVNISGSFNHGKYITISGSGFGTKSPAKPLVWAPFESGSVNRDTTLSDGGILSTSNLSLSSADLPHSRSSSAVRGIPYIASPYTKSGPQVKFVASSTIVDLYTFVRRKYAHPNYFDGVDNYKFYRLWPPSGKNYPNYIAMFHLGRTRFYAEAGAGPAPSLAGYMVPTNAWFTEEFQLHQGGTDISDTTGKFWINGVQKASFSIITRTASSPDQWRWLSIENFWTINPPPSGAYVYFDDVYIDTTWARVMIGNASTFSACTHREPLIPTAWSASSITAYFNQGAFSNGQSVYVFVVDSNGNASPGKQISIGGVADYVSPPNDESPAPNPPVNINIK